MRILTNKYQLTVLLLLSISATGVNAQEQPADDLPDTVIETEDDAQAVDELDIDAMDDLSIQQEEPAGDPASDSDIEAEETEPPADTLFGADIMEEEEENAAVQSALPAEPVEEAGDEPDADAMDDISIQQESTDDLPDADIGMETEETAQAEDALSETDSMEEENAAVQSVLPAGVAEPVEEAEDELDADAVDDISVQGLPADDLPAADTYIETEETEQTEDILSATDIMEEEDAAAESVFPAGHVEPLEETDEETDDEAEDKLATDGRIFGYRRGLLHGALALNAEWTDNLYNYDANKEENLLTVITPSAWMTWPRRSRRPVQMAADNTMPGGLQYSLTDYEMYNKYEVYLAGKLDAMRYSANSDLDHIEHGIEAMARYQPMLRLNFHVLDKFTHSQDIFNITEATLENNRVYDANIFGLGADWRFADKMTLQLTYKHFDLTYEEDINNFLNRTDNGFTGKFAYDYSPKTDFFGEYHYILASYDESDSKVPDNGNSIVNAGINWQATVKTAFMAKAGYQLVHYDTETPDYDEAETPDTVIDDDKNGLYFEAQASWQATRKSEFILNSKYSVEQTDSEYALNKTVFSTRAAYGHRFTDKIRGDINVIYEDSDYALFDGRSRLDERWYIKPELQFAMKKWLSFRLYYSFDTKDSNFDELDYETNTLGIGVRGAF
ncbi:MAG: outer membrane beta-barrel protein [Candidatus Electrothrix sp. YB6]